MNGLNKLERKFGKYAIPNLMYYVVILYAIGLIISQLAPQVYIEYLMLDASKILRGQIWRVVTFMMWPMSGGILINVVMMYCYYNLGRTLEYIWGTFRFNLYFFMGVLGHVLAAIIIYLVLGRVYPLTTEYLNFSLFMAYALTFPEQHFLLFWVVPIKAKWLAAFNAAYFVYGFIFGGAAAKIAIAMSMFNVIVYFFMTKGSRYSPKEIKRKQQFKAQMNQTAREVKKVGRHRCAVCGRTELDAPELTFRYCSKCDGDFEYCQDHLYTHQHVTRGGMDPRQAESYPTHRDQ